MMDDLISRSALFKTWDALDETQDPNLLVDAMIKATQEAPAVDAVEVVRCKDCESGLGRLLNCDGDVEGVWCDRWSKIMPTHGYCHECGAKMYVEVQDGDLSQT